MTSTDDANRMQVAVNRTLSNLNEALTLWQVRHVESGATVYCRNRLEAEAHVRESVSGPWVAERTDRSIHMTASDEAYDRLHGVDGHAQAAVTPRYTPGPTDAAAWACLACRANETREDVAQFEAPCEVHAAVEMSRKAEQAERRAEDAEVEVERLRDVLAEVRRVFDLQCPPMLPEKYVDRGAWMAHSWWNTVLGSILNREGVGTGAGEGATGQDTGTAWVTRSTDCPEAPAQAHPLGPDGFTRLA